MSVSAGGPNLSTTILYSEFLCFLLNNQQNENIVSDFLGRNFVFF